MAVTGQTGALTGAWFNVPRDARTRIPVIISLQAGTATFFLEGRNDPSDDAISLGTGSADAVIEAVRCAQMRLRLSAATGATIRASTDIPLVP